VFGEDLNTKGVKMDLFVLLQQDVGLAKLMSKSSAKKKG